MGRLSEARLGDVLPVLDRYRPVALATAAILSIVAVLPGAEVGAGADTGSAPALPFEEAASGPTDLAVSAGGAAVGAEEPAAPVIAAPVPSPGGTSTGTRTTTRPNAGATASPSFSPTNPSSSPTFALPSGDDSEDPRPLTPTVTGWATTAAGTPLGEIGVPEGSLPVGTRLTQTDKASFLRLVGDERNLVLTEVADGGRGADAAVQACVITESGWQGGGNQSFDDAPAWDADACVPGMRSDEGAWTFALGMLGAPDDPRGYALVPGADAPADFQVAFSAGS